MEPAPRETVLGRVARAFVRTLLWTAAAFAVWIAVGFTYTDRRWAKTDQAWGKVNRTDAELRARYPTRFTNSAGFALDAAARKLGLPLIPRDRSLVKGTPAAGIVLANADLRDTLRAGDGRLHVPAAELETALPHLRETLQRVLDVLLAEPPPVFASSLEPRENRVAPDLGSYRALHRLLLFEVLDRERLGDVAGVQRSLEAAWRLSDVFALDPDIGALSRDYVSYGELATTLRFLPSPSLDWPRRLAEIDPRGRFRDQEQADDCLDRSVWWDLPFGTPPSEPARFAGAPVEFLFVAPLQRYDAVLMSRWRSESLRVRAETPHCAEPPWDPAPPGWSVQRFLGLPTAWDPAPRPGFPPTVADRLALRLELTRKVIEARIDRARLGHFDLPAAGSVESYCPGERWIYELAADGSLAIRLSNPDLLGGLPLAFRIPSKG